MSQSKHDEKHTKGGGTPGARAVGPHSGGTSGPKTSSGTGPHSKSSGTVAGAPRGKFKTDGGMGPHS